MAPSSLDCGPFWVAKSLFCQIRVLSNHQTFPKRILWININSLDLSVLVDRVCVLQVNRVKVFCLASASKPPSISFPGPPWNGVPNVTILGTVCVCHGGGPWRASTRLHNGALFNFRSADQAKLRLD